MKVKGRGTVDQPINRFAHQEYQSFDDGWYAEADIRKPKTTLHRDPSRKVVSRNKSPDLPFDRSINPYKGCEHGCIYCYARPTHAYLDLSPGLDFETQIFYKPDAASLLRKELENTNYQCKPIGLGTNTDPWQQAERKLGITRNILDVLNQFNHPVTIVTKSTGIERDIDILSIMAEKRQVLVNISICTLDEELSRRMEPRAASPSRKLRTIERLSKAGIPVGVIIGPVIPILNDSDIERILEQSSNMGAVFSHYIMLRLPFEVAPLFENWLDDHYPLKKDHIMNRVRDIRGGKLNQSNFGQRMHGQGIFAELIENRFKRAWGYYNYQAEPILDCKNFRNPNVPIQSQLF